MPTLKNKTKINLFIFQRSLERKRSFPRHFGDLHFRLSQGCLQIDCSMHDRKGRMYSHKKKKITYPTNSRSRLLKLTPVDVFARISRKIWGNFRTMHMTSVLKLAKCSSVSDSMIIITTTIPTEICQKPQDFSLNPLLPNMTALKLDDFRENFRVSFSK